MTLVVRYDKSDASAQGLLRLALFEEWDGKCHWCNTPAENATFHEIDHILPRKNYDELRAELIDDAMNRYTPEYLAELRELPVDKDDIRNLAPICAAGPRCNQKKSGAYEDDMIGAISTSLKKAARLSTKVANRVRQMTTSQGDEKNLVALLALSNTQETVKLLHTYGPLILESLWRLDKRAFETFRVPAEIQLRVDEGVIPDYFSDATRTGTGLDGLLRLNHAEQIALSNSELLFGVDAAGRMSEEISEAIGELDTQITATLGDIEHPTIEGPRWLSITNHEFQPGERPTFDVELTMEVAIGGDARIDDDINGMPRYRQRSVKAHAIVRCRVYLNDGETEHWVEQLETDID